jgi:hypothetical protein
VIQAICRQYAAAQRVLPYDTMYAQCMYARGYRVPGFSPSLNSPGYQGELPGPAAHLSRYNEFFDKQSEIESRILRVIDFIEECGFYPKSRVWRKADLLTLLVELDIALNEENLNLDPLKVVADLQGFYGSIDSGSVGDNSPPGIYYKAALQASNDRVNRVRRGMIVGGILRGEKEKAILGRLRQEGLA